jgi:hypothetical protein
VHGGALQPGVGAGAARAVAERGEDDLAHAAPVVVAAHHAKLTKAAADGLNQAFATTAFTEGLTIGTATVAATAA